MELLNAAYMEHANIEFEFSKQSIICCPGCITLGIALTDQDLHRCQFFLSTVHDTIFLGHPACHRLNMYTLQIENMALKFNQHQLQPQLRLDTTETKQKISSCNSADDLKKTFWTCFDGIGNFPGEYHITVDANIQPRQHARRKVPIELKDKIKAKLDKLI